MLGSARESRSNPASHRLRQSFNRFMSRFEREVDPDGSLPENEGALRADAARRAFYAELALKRHQRGDVQQEALTAYAQRAEINTRLRRVRSRCRFRARQPPGI